MSDEAVKAKTRRTWNEWFTLLDGEGAQAMSHAAIARHLAEAHGVEGWWAQNVTVEYEKERGLRVLHQRCEGAYAASASKTIAVPVERLFAAFEDAQALASWLPEGGLRVRKANAPKSIRYDWGTDGSRVNVNLWDKGPGKSQVAIEHILLRDVASAERLKAFWRERLETLKGRLEA